ncbi:ABC transporter ATP-binding protein [Tropicimonas sp. IMCC34011]|uniref:ABC transporter ATP-binding protein n=1 Tax=Tropicimonas sp. IMCC34011 TaxID=2248759 RepID=UPI000E252E26|nr:ABC transporter ATP-binding protein [Tropicimonas sp. IMCC34011]
MTLDIASISKSYEGTPVLRDVSLTIADGEFVALLGPSGSGKTTLLNVISGLVTPDEGRLTLDGTDITATPAGERRFGMVFQSYALFRHMTVAQNVAFGLRVRTGRDRTSRKSRDARVEELLALIEMESFGDRYPAQLSGGQQQRVAMARALAIDPRLLLLDEPFSALDAQVRQSLRGSVRELQQRVGIASILVTHDQAEAFAVADRVVLMRDGRIEQVGTASDLRERPTTDFVRDFLAS